MLLAINIGNTNIHIGLFKGLRLKHRQTLPANKSGYNRDLKKLTAKYKIESAVICSVLPRLTKIIAGALKEIPAAGSIYIIGKDIRVPIKNLYRKPCTLGQDRLINAYAAASIYGVPALAIDFGTAITFDVVSRKKKYLGGMILAGIGASLEALAQKTELLPRLRLRKPKEFLGRSTQEGMLSGAIYGSARLTDGMITQIKAAAGKDTKVIACGGDARLIGAYCRNIDKIDTDLTLKGINLVYQKINQKKRSEKVFLYDHAD